jgi:hypothetical protein
MISAGLNVLAAILLGITRSRGWGLGKLVIFKIN